ncbi:hypothetical protein CPELA_10780 [Corynebacterium pelargi]|uniref:Uncharacterized protein n=1 Tax=Corynebacterium pelargi TaxID=1471400 RepID=A0A410WBQ5_9CORY|nr:hypothetical protein CPELA_10780 [Corynebacterium pelargi]
MAKLNKFSVYTLPGFLFSMSAALWLELVSSGWTQIIHLLVLLHFGMRVSLFKWTWWPMKQPGTVWLSLNQNACPRRGGICKSC